MVPGGGRLIRLQESDPSQLFDELTERFFWDSRGEIVFEFLSDVFERGSAVEFAKNPVLRFAEAKEPSCRRIFDDERRPLRPFLPARDEIVTKLGGIRHVSHLALQSIHANGRLQSVGRPPRWRPSFITFNFG